MTIIDDGWVTWAKNQQTIGTSGLGGTVVQLTSKATGVTINFRTGRITTHAAALAAGAKVTFVVTNSVCEATDIPVLAIVSPASKYRANVSAVNAGSFAVTLENVTAGNLSEAVSIAFAIMKGSTS